MRRRFKVDGEAGEPDSRQDCEDDSLNVKYVMRWLN